MGQRKRKDNVDEAAHGQDNQGETEQEEEAEEEDIEDTFDDDEKDKDFVVDKSAALESESDEEELESDVSAGLNGLERID